MSLPLLVIMVPVLFGLMGFALDLGRLYLVKGELNSAASSMALAAAQQLNGTANSDAALQAVLPPSGPSYFYNFGSIAIGSSTGNLTSTVNPAACYGTLADALAGNGNVVACGCYPSCGGTSEFPFVQVSLTAEAPLLFWSLLPGGQLGKTSVGALAVAGISAPLCTACGIVPFAVKALDTTDTVNFGFDSSFSTTYTLYYSCLGTVPSTLASDIPYVVLNRYDTANATLDESDQLYANAAQGLIASTNPTPNAVTTSNPAAPTACVNLYDSEQVWAAAVPQTCTAPTAAVAVQASQCGLYSRLDNTQSPTACTTAVTDFASLSAAYLPDTDVLAGEAPPYSAYTGNGRRVITVAIVDAMPPDVTTAMTVLGFRQFLLTPNADGTFFNPGDQYGRFTALYIGYPAPVQQGWFDTRYAPSCPVGSFTGPGKVVLHQ